MRQPRQFTLDEALELLPTVRDLVQKIQSSKRELDQLNAQLEGASEGHSSNGHSGGRALVLREQASRRASNLDGLIRQLQAIGCELKGVDQGLVDFPSMRDGRIVYLCWQAGEDTISFWHDVDAGFAGRQPL